jgi:hypothetical protein
MIVEHVFITTYEAPDTLRVASQFLAARGFEAVAQAAFAMGPATWNALEMTRGRKNAARAKSVLEFPQQVRIEWDRGRVTVAASARSPQEAQVTGWSTKPKGIVARLEEQMLTGIVTHLQQLLEARIESDQVLAAWAGYENRLHEADRSRRRRNLWISLTIIFLLFGSVAFIIFMVARSP